MLGRAERRDAPLTRRSICFAYLVADEIYKTRYSAKALDMRCQNGNASEVTLCVWRAAGRIATIVAGGNISNANKVSIYRISSEARNISSLSVAKTYRRKKKYILHFGARHSPWCFALRSFTKRAAVEQSSLTRLCEHRLASFDYTTCELTAVAVALRASSSFDEGSRSNLHSLACASTDSLRLIFELRSNIST